MIKQQTAQMSGSRGDYFMSLYEFSQGCITNMAEEIRRGLVQNLRLRVAGEVLSDLIGMAKEALAEKSIEVAAVLTAAAYEDLVRRLALEKIGLSARMKLEQVVSELKVSVAAETRISGEVHVQADRSYDYDLQVKALHTAEEDAASSTKLLQNTG